MRDLLQTAVAASGSALVSHVHRSAPTRLAGDFTVDGQWDLTAGGQRNCPAAAEGAARWRTNRQATSPAQVYVLCLHTSLPPASANVACPDICRFWVIPGRALDAGLGAQRTLGLATLQRLTGPIRWDRINRAVDCLIG